MNTFQISRRAFSLVEVVVAVGIFALAIVGVIDLLSPTTKAVGDVFDNDAASRVVTIVQAELQALAYTSAGWSSFTTGSTSILRSSNDIANYDANTNPDYMGAESHVLFSSRDGSIVGSALSTGWDGGTPVDEDSRKFFEIVLIRNWNPTATPTSGLSDPANDLTHIRYVFVGRLTCLTARVSPIIPSKAS
jgi:type II secretory pathway pseudopilin PulG